MFQEPFSRIKKELLKEVKSLGPGERVLVMGNSREPYLCVKKDEKAFINFWNKHIYMPLPDYASRKVVWPGLFERHQVRGVAWKAQNAEPSEAGVRVKLEETV